MNNSRLEIERTKLNKMGRTHPDILEQSRKLDKLIIKDIQEQLKNKGIRQ